MNDTDLLEDYKQSDFDNAICVDTSSENLQIRGRLYSDVYQNIGLR